MKFLSENEIKNEFSHTVLHKQNFREEKLIEETP